MLVYVGTYTRGRSEGIYIFRMDTTTGALEAAGKATEIPNPSFLALHPRRPYLYAVNEVGEFEGRPGGAVSAFRIDETSGALTLLNQQSTVGAGPCHLSVDGTGRFVLAANYGGGSVCVLPIGEDGRLGAASDFVQHRGSSINPQRQEGPHAHSILPDPANRYVLAADLGLDKVLVYQFDSTQGKLRPNDPLSADLKPGAGPRHFAFHPNGRCVYVINELDSTMTVFGYDETHGMLGARQTISTLPDGFAERNSCADVHVHPSGRFVYGSNRGHDSLVIYATDPETGRLTLVGHEPTRGRTPRNFGIDPTGEFLLAANQNTDTIVPFRIDVRSGRLSPTDRVTEVPTPVCVKFRR